MTRYIAITAKCSDCCSVTVFDDALLVANHEGYVPNDLGVGGGEYIELLIDAETGKVCGWDSEKVNKQIEKMSNKELDT